METSTVTMIRYCTCNTALFIRVLGQDVHDDDNDDAIAIGLFSLPWIASVKIFLVYWKYLNGWG